MSFQYLTPDFILDSVESLGLEPTGEMTQLNSYENRVFDLKLEDGNRVIAKFYRTNRWSEKALLEEHQFISDLASSGVHVVQPLTFSDKTLFELKDQGSYFCLYPKFKGRMPQEFLKGELQKVGRTLARLHNAGAQAEFKYRPSLTTNFYGYNSLDILNQWVAPEVSSRYFSAAQDILSFLDEKLDRYPQVRIHGDCHKGNLLNNEQDFFFVDFDDCINGIEAQDFWMLLDRENFEEELDQILEGYEELRDFDLSQKELFEPLRGLRIMYYARWIATRWNDPSFPRLFPNFESYAYWAQETEQLEKIAWSL